MARYDANTANTNRIVKFRVEAAAAGNAESGIFGMLKGRANHYPFYGQLATTPTANQNLAQLRTSLVAQALKNYSIIVGLKLVDDSYGTGGLTANFGPALLIEFETDENGVYFNQSWPTNTTLAKHLTTDITDNVGAGGMTTPKTKSGLSNLLASLATVSYDGGVTGPFGLLSASGAIVLRDGTTTAGAPDLDDGVGTNASGLRIVYVE